jgi:glycosyltransferase involved in cell wall biosynthesis
MPRVSIVIPTYNRADLLPFTLNSTLNQTHADLEIIVVDNASTDDTPQYMAQFAGRVRYIRKPVNKGLVDSYNMGIRESSGELIMLLDSDDTIHPGTIATQVKYLDQHPHMDLVRTAGYYVDLHGNKIARVRLAPTGAGRRLLSSLALGNFEMCGSILYRRSTINRVGFQDVNLPVYGDWEYSLRMALMNCHFGFVAEPLFFYRFHPGNSMKRVQSVEFTSGVILDRLFSNPDLPAEIKPLRKEASAQASLFLAFSYYATQSSADAQRCLLSAWQDHPRWHAQPAQMLDAMLDYSLYMHVVDLETFAGYVTRNLPQSLPALREHVAIWVSHIHLLQAFSRYDRGEIDAGKAEFKKALALDPALAAKRHDFAVILRKFAMQAVMDPPAKFVETVLNNLPEPARALRHVRNRVEADMALITAYASMQDNDREAARQLTHALRLDPSLIARRGVVAPLLRSLAHQVKHA